jgi:hypothetical protein
MSATLIIALIVQAAELVAKLAGINTGKAGPIATEIVALIAKLDEMIASARAVLDAGDLPALEAELARVHPQVLALSAEFDAALAEAATR